jgi:hypothetical protein
VARIVGKWSKKLFFMLPIRFSVPFAFIEQE